MFDGLVADIPLGGDGLTGSQNLALLRPTQLLQAENVTYDEGVVRKEGGSAFYSITPLAGNPTILGGWDWWPDSTSQYMIVVTANGRLVADDGTGAFGQTLLGPADPGVPVFVEGGAEAPLNPPKLFVFGTGFVKVIEGNPLTSHGLTGAVPSEWTNNYPKTACNHASRLWAAVGHRVYYTRADDHEDFSTGDAGQLAVFPGEGDRIVQILSYKGLLIVWKYPSGIYAVNTTSPTLSNWSVSRISQSIGASGAQNAVMIDDDVLFVDQAGNIQLLSGIQEFGEVGSRDLTHVHDLNPFTRGKVNLSRLAFARAVYYAVRREVHIALTTIGQHMNDARLVVDFNRPGLPRFRWSPREVCEGLWIRRDVRGISTLVAGSDLGFIRLLDQATRSSDDIGGVPLGYLGSIQTAHTDFSYLDPALATRRKEARFLELVLESVGTWPVYADIIWDGRTTQTLTFNFSSLSALGSFVLGTSVLGGRPIWIVRRRAVGGGHRFSVRLYNSAAGHDFAIARAALYFKPGDERITQ